MRRTGLVAGAICALGTLGLLSPATAVAAASSPQSVTFTTAETPAGTATEWIVPDGVSSLTVTVSGGNGGSPNPARPGGRGAVVTADMPVEPGQTLLITLGADGAPSVTGGAGYGAGGTGVISGGGGGSTAITLDDEVWIIAGGGGGSSERAGAGGGGGAGGTPAGLAGSRRGGAGGAEGVGGIGVAPWGGPGGAGYFGSGGTVNGTEAGAGGGGGFGGGGASGAYGDGGGGGSYVHAETTGAFASRLDDLVDGWVQLDFEQELIEPSPTPSASTEPVALRDSIAGVPYAVVGAAAAAVVLIGTTLMLLGRRSSARRDRDE